MRKVALLQQRKMPAAPPIPLGLRAKLAKVSTLIFAAAVFVCCFIAQTFRCLKLLQSKLKMR